LYFSFAELTTPALDWLRLFYLGDSESSDWSTKLTTYIQLVPKIRMSGIILHTPIYLDPYMGNNSIFLLVEWNQWKQTFEVAHL
jgi:hypothetical protein